MVASSFALVSLLPMIVAMIAAFAAVVLASRIARKAESDYVPETTIEETIAWVTSFEDLNPRDFRGAITAACSRAKARVETRKREMRAVMTMMICYWYERQLSEMSDLPDPLVTLEWFDTIDACRAILEMESDAAVAA